MKLDEIKKTDWVVLPEKHNNIVVAAKLIDKNSLRSTFRDAVGNEYRLLNKDQEFRLATPKDREKSKDMLELENALVLSGNKIIELAKKYQNDPDIIDKQIPGIIENLNEKIAYGKNLNEQDQERIMNVKALFSNVYQNVKKASINMLMSIL